MPPNQGCVLAGQGYDPPIGQMKKLSPEGIKCLFSRESLLGAGSIMVIPSGAVPTNNVHAEHVT